MAIVLSSCVPMVVTPVSTRTIVPTDAYALPPLSTITVGYIPTSTYTSTITPTKPLPLETGLPPTPTITPNQTQAREQEKIQEVIQGYFELRYSLFSTSPPGEITAEIFRKFVSGEEEAKDFLETETAKLAVERKWYELRKLRYAEYEYTFKYTEIRIDAVAQVATVSLHEYFEIICERAMENNPQDPSPCAIGELAHKIILSKEQDEWKINFDIYKDSWWRQFRRAGMTTEEILKEIEAEMEKLEATPSPCE